MKIVDQTHDQFADAFHRRYRKGTHFSTPVYRHVMKAGKMSLHELAAFSHLSELAGQVEADLEPSPGRIIKQVSDGDVVKYVMRLEDGLDIESVVIPCTGATPCVYPARWGAEWDAVSAGPARWDC